MRKTILFASILACFAVGKSSAQTVNGVKLSDLKADYLEFTTYNRAFANKTFIWLEYGQKVLNDRQAALIKDNDGKMMEFKSAMDFLNHMKTYGYELFSAYAVSDKKDNVLQYYVLKRKE
jgi:hypothetical protein